MTEEQLHQLNALLTSRIAGLNAFSGDSSRKKDAEGLHCLTVREQEVLTLIASGYTRPEVAAALGVTRNTAATHIASIYRKLDIGSIAEATMLAVRWGVLG
ncbi:LuxR C-terminal-related transcriptional regulator [Granulosicoccus sp. 3-233]|uniref:LuxR C-terminal-related transcriptional regulator n=1 Tax=Granulosicoccus sp. 3-233 TaxID=3417969 RepID=UPI003D338148